MKTADQVSADDRMVLAGRYVHGQEAIDMRLKFLTMNGESCISLEEAPPPKQQIVCSRSFGERVTTYEAMRQAVCQYAERAAEKLRGERQAGILLYL